MNHNLSLVALTAAAASLSTLLGQPARKSFESKGKAMERITALCAELTEQGRSARFNEETNLFEEVTAPAAPVAEKVVRKSSRAGFADDLVIEVLVANPKRVGKPAFARFACYETGKTVEDFCNLVTRRAGLSDLAHDVDQGFVAVHTAEAWAVIQAERASKEVQVLEAA